MAERKRGEFLSKRQPLFWPPLFIFIFLFLFIVISGFFYYQKQKKEIFHEQITQLKAIADLKAADIQHWLGERMGNARLIAENRILTAELLAFLRDRSAGPRRESILSWMESLRKNYHYQKVMLLDSSGEWALSRAGPHPTVDHSTLELLERVRRRKEAMNSDLHRPAKGAPPHMGIAVPLLTADTVAGFVYLGIDPAGFLFPMIQSWPTPSPSAETLLVRREGKEVVFLNELRHRRNTALNLRLPLTSRELPAAMAVSGKTGAFSGRDYRGVAVWSVVRPVPDSPWFIVAKIDREEIERPNRRSALAIFLVALSLLLASALIILTMWQRQNARFRLSQLEAENQRQALVQHFDFLTRYANDIIILADEKWNMLEVNERALVTYGYDREALLKMNIRDMRIPEERDKLAVQTRQLDHELGLVFETMHQKKDGSVFPVEVSARVIIVNDKKYYQNIIRDISERRRAESQREAALKALWESEDKFRYIFDNSVVGKSITLPDGEINVNKAFCEMLGYSSEEMKARKWQELTYPDDVECTEKALDVILSGEKDSIRFDKRYLHKNGSIVWADVSTALRRDAEGKPLYFVTTVLDISERKRSEDKVRKSEEHLQSTLDNMLEGCQIIGFDWRYLYANNAVARHGHRTKDELLGHAMMDVYPGIENTEMFAVLRRCMNDRMPQQMENEFAYPDGTKAWFELSMQPVPEGVFILSIDISERKRTEAKLRHEQTLYMDLVNALPAGMYRLRVKPAANWHEDNWRSQVESRYFVDFVSDRFCEITGINREEFTANPAAIPDRIHPDDNTEFVRRNTAAILSMSAFSWEGRMTVPEKGTIWVRFESIPRLLENGDVIWTGIVNDISERKQAESQKEAALEALRKSEKRLKETQEMARLGHWHWNVNTGDVEWSEEVYKIFQLDPGTFTPHIDSILALSPWPEDHRRDQELISRAMKNHEQGTYEQRFLRPDKSIGYYHSTFQGVYDAKGKLTFIIGTVLDITERKRAEEEIKSARAFLEMVIDMSPIAMWISDKKGTITRVNRSLCDFINLTEDKIVGKYNVFKDENLKNQGVMPSVKAVFEKYTPARFIIPWMATEAGSSDFKGARNMHIDVSMFPILDRQGELMNVVCQWIDISDRMRAEDRIRALNAELEQKVQQRTAQLEASNKELEAFSYSVSHDLRSPLRAIEGFARIMLEEYAPKLDGEGRRLLDVIAGNTRKMGQLIDDLLAFSRLNRQPMASEPVDMNALAGAVFSELKNLEKKRRIEFKLNDLPACRGDRSLLRQVLQNLLANAIKFTRTKSPAHIEFGAQAASGETIYYIKDNGVGFDMKYAHKLFGVFQRLHGSEEFEGTGVGLAIVQRIVLHHGGRIWAEGTVGKGATFYFSLPQSIQRE